MNRLVPTAVLALAACGPSTPPASGPKGGSTEFPVTAEAVALAKQKWPDATEASLGAGRELYIAKCNACHDHPKATAVKDEEWPKTLEEMGKKANLDAKQTELVLRFVLAARPTK